MGRDRAPAPPQQLLPVMFCVDFCRLARMMVSVSVMAMRRMCFVGRLFVVAGLMMFRRFAVMFCSMLVMRGCVRMVLMRFVGRHPVFLLCFGWVQREH